MRCSVPTERAMRSILLGACRSAGMSISNVLEVDLGKRVFGALGVRAAAYH